MNPTPLQFYGLVGGLIVLLTLYLLVLRIEMLKRRKDPSPLCEKTQKRFEEKFVESETRMDDEVEALGEKIEALGASLGKDLKALAKSIETLGEAGTANAVEIRRVEAESKNELRRVETESQDEDRRIDGIYRADVGKIYEFMREQRREIFEEVNNRFDKVDKENETIKGLVTSLCEKVGVLKGKTERKA